MLKTFLKGSSIEKLNILPHNLPIGMRVTVSCTEAASSMNTWEKWLELKFLSILRPLTKEPAVNSVEITTRNLYKNSNAGNLNCPLIMLQIGRIFGLILSLSCDFAKILIISFGVKWSTRRSAISSQAALELQHTSTQLSVDRTISKIAATKVLVFPVPI